MSHCTTRRGFLKAGAAAAGAAAVSGCAFMGGNADKPDYGLYAGPIIDPHQHLWNLKEQRLPWVAGLQGRPKEVLGRDYGPAEYAEATRGQNVVKAVYMEVDVAEDQQVDEAERVARLCAASGTPTAAAVISGRPASDGFSAYLDRFKGNRYIKGLRQVLHTPATPDKLCLDDKFVRGVQMLGDRGLSFDICVRCDQLEYAAELIDRCPQTRFVVDHCGNPHNGKLGLDGWEAALAKTARTKNPNVMCKISGLYGNVSSAEWPAVRLSPIVHKVISLFGRDRVMFAGDWPVVNLGASFAVWVDTLRQIVRGEPPEAQRKLFHDNAAKFYRLG